MAKDCKETLPGTEGQKNLSRIYLRHYTALLLWGSSLGQVPGF